MRALRFAALVVATILMAPARAADLPASPPTVATPGPTNSEAPERLSWADLQAFRTDLPERYPATSCALQALMGKDHERLLAASLAGGASGASFDWENLKSEDGSVFVVERQWATADHFVMWFHRSGAIVVGVSEKKRLKLYANDSTRVDTLPAAIAAWKAAGEAEGGKTEWVHKAKASLEFPAACLPTALADDLKNYRLAEEGLSCDVANLKNLSFTQTPSFVPASVGKLPLANSSAYLVAGDMVQILETDFKVKPIEGKVCVYYQSAKGKRTMGWVPAGSLRTLGDEDSAAVDEEFGKLAKMPWFALTQNRINYPGKYRRDNEKVADRLRIKVLSDAIQANFHADGRVFDHDTVVAKTVSSRVARFKDDSQSATFFLLNNGIYSHVKNDLLGTHSWTIYYP